jgi:hypothetical protein
MMAGTMIMANVTGGMQDQMRFEDENGNWLNFNEISLLTILELIKNMVNGLYQYFLLTHL